MFKIQWLDMGIVNVRLTWSDIGLAVMNEDLKEIKLKEILLHVGLNLGNISIQQNFAVCNLDCCMLTLTCPMSSDLQEISIAYIHSFRDGHLRLDSLYGRKLFHYIHILSYLGLCP